MFEKPNRNLNHTVHLVVIWNMFSLICRCDINGMKNENGVEKNVEENARQTNRVHQMIFIVQMGAVQAF